APPGGGDGPWGAQTPVPPRREELPARGGVPPPDGAVLAGGVEAAAVRGEDGPAEPTLMPGARVEGLAGGDVPEPDGLAGTAAGEHPAVRGEGQRGGRALSPAGLQLLTAGRGPKDDGRDAPVRDHPAVRGEGPRPPDEEALRRPALQPGFPRLHVPDAQHGVQAVRAGRGQRLAVGGEGEAE